MNRLRFLVPGGTFALVLFLWLVAYSSERGDSFVARASDREVNIILPAAWWDDGAINLAIGDLTEYVVSTYGTGLSVIRAENVAVLPSGSMVVGDIRSVWITRLVEDGSFTLPALAEEGYSIQRISHNGESVTVIAGYDVLGTTYGIFQFIERSRIDPGFAFGPVKLTQNPQMSFRLVSDPTDPFYPSPEQALRWGFNAIAVGDWPTLALYDGFDRAIYDPDRYGPERDWVEANRKKTRERIAVAKKLHLKVISSGDVISFPKQVANLYQGEVANGAGTPLWCINKPKTQALLSYALREVLTDFPEIEAIMVRTGENYAKGPVTGNTPAQEYCGNSQNSLVPLRLAIDTVRAQVVDTFGKTYIQRAWDLGDSGFHGSPDVATALLQGLPKNDKLVLSFKHTRTDFWRFNEINPNLGKGQLPQMIEFQAAREYEGKGAFPNYLGKEAYSAMGYAYQHGIRFVWVWAKGGGWGGPYPKSNLWVEANVYALNRLAWDTGDNPNIIAKDWATLRFGPRAASVIGRMLMLSPEAVLKGFYVSPYARKQGNWAPNALWVRDDEIYGGEKMLLLYRASYDEASFDEALREKTQAATIVEQMVVDFRGVRNLIPDKELMNWVSSSLEYERSLVETLRYYLEGVFYFYRWQDSSKMDDSARQQALKSLALWRESWDRHQREASSPYGAATPFKNQGMVDTLALIVRELEGND